MNDAGAAAEDPRMKWVLLTALIGGVFAACTSPTPPPGPDEAEGDGGTAPEISRAPDLGQRDRPDRGVEDAADVRDAEPVDIRTRGAPPRMVLSCAAPSSTCGDPAPEFGPCVGMNFGDVAANEPPCDRLIELRNLPRDGEPTRDLVIERLAFTVNEPASGRVVTGPEVGFSIHGLDGAELLVGPRDPLVVTIPAGQTEGRRRLWARFSGIRRGLFLGDPQVGTGLHLTSNDPDQPLLSWPVSGFGSGPKLEVWPPYLDFGPIAPGVVQTQTLTLTNIGERPLSIWELQLAVDRAGVELNFRTIDGIPPLLLGVGEARTVAVRYAPSTGQPLRDQLVIRSDDAEAQTIVVPVISGSAPRLAVDPPGLEFAASPASASFTLNNVGDEDLVISGLAIVGYGGDLTSSSVDDFRIAGCPEPCSPGWVLCAAGNAGCGTSSLSVEVELDDNDAVPSDHAELRIHSNDPAQPEQILLLRRAPGCPMPAAAVEVQTLQPRVAHPVQLGAVSSGPGGGEIIAYEWSVLFAPSGLLPALTAVDGPSTAFVPLIAGPHLVGLRVTDRCGQVSPLFTSTSIDVAE